MADDNPGSFADTPNLKQGRSYNMTRLWKTTMAALGGVAMIGLAGTGPAAAEDTITVASWGGAYSMSQREAYYKPAAKEINLTILEDEWTGTIPEIRVQVETGEYKWHVIDSEGGTVLAACDEGLLYEFDFEMFGGRDGFLPNAALDCGVGTISWATIYAYDGDVYPDEASAPSTVDDFFDVEKFPGKRGLYANGFSHTMQMALIADGVPADEMANYMNDNPQEAIERAFAKLDTIKEHVIYWDSGAMAPQLLADGEVVMTTAWNGRIYNAVVQEGKNFKIVWDGQGIDYDYWIIPAGHPETDLGLKFIEYASRPDVMARQSQYISYGPTTYAAGELINPDIAQHLPTAPQNTGNAYWVDTIWWGDHTEELTERFNVWRSQ